MSDEPNAAEELATWIKGESVKLSSAIRDRDLIQRELDHAEAELAIRRRHHRHELAIVCCSCQARVAVTSSEPIDPVRHALSLAAMAISIGWRLSPETSAELAAMAHYPPGAMPKFTVDADVCPNH